MSKYQCSRCNRNFTKKCHLEDHLNRKNICQISSEIHQDPPKYHQIPLPATKIPPNTIVSMPTNNEYTCYYCNKAFVRKDVADKHMRLSCKVAKQQNKEKQEIFDKLLELESKNKLLEDENKKLKNEIKTVQSITVSNSNNNNNNTTNNIINVNVVPHGEEDLSKYSNLLLILAAKRGINAVLELTDRIHFNSQLPEFQNVYIPDIKNKHAMVFDKVWSLKNTDDVISNIYETKSDFIKENKDVFFDHLSVGEKIVYERWATADNNRNTKEYKEYIDSMHDKIKLLLYNKRNIVIANKKRQNLKNNKIILEGVVNNS